MSERGEQERADFERWAKDYGRIFLDRQGDGYAFSYTNEAWVSWQARAALAHRAAQEGRPIGVEAVATVEGDKDGLYIDWLIEGGICALEPGEVLVVATGTITDDYGSGVVYKAAPQPAAHRAEAAAGRGLASGIDLPPSRAEAAFSRECDDADELIRMLGLEPDAVRTDGGSINLARVRTFLSERKAEAAAEPVAPTDADERRRREKERLMGGVL